MEKEVVKKNQHPHNNTNNNNISTTTSLRERHIIGDGFIKPPHSTDLVLRWGSRKRLRCMKIQVKNESSPTTRITARVDRRVVRSDHNNTNNGTVGTGNHTTNGFNLRQRPASPAHPPSRVLRPRCYFEDHQSEVTQGWREYFLSLDPRRLLFLLTLKTGLAGRNSESGSGMKTQNNNYQNNGGGGGGMKGLGSPEREKKSGGAHNHHENTMINGGGKTTSSETKGGGSSSGGGSDVVWPPKFVIALTNKEKEEDFMAIKGSKLPQRPKKRAKFIQRNLNLVSPGGWLCDLTLERYEVREKKISKKRPRGLKAMGNYMESDSE
ncbi:uncharacterized protein LOC130803965 isoform X1 [Amaranthus tricolor]|uniref:uncharacterized protein LOC130803965 isoform X1 n=1 Tax=Amaranthus tricolor TaxID=29722 RepID=UPI002589A33E|nr:uncharacterized protein LOC130803965 isoform X1 [Amaranthus tricolor]